ncbi:MAG: 16S rRNA (uracil(1498)-N(3))-methyltransferase [Oscillospiraceae bacterium]|nr:16S rRNA (uracil(1498)-N(3))-methyltransferase [Oscillospiraceae bacterium]
MPRFFTTDITDNRAIVTGDDAHHIIKSLRMRMGEQITLCDGRGFDYHGVIAAVNEKYVEVEIRAKSQSPGEAGIRVALYQAMPKSDKLDFIVQKAVELGAYEVIPVLSERCVSRPDEKSMGKKLERLNRTALEAAKQCGRGVIPRVLPMMDFPAAIIRMKSSALPILCYENAAESLSARLKPGVTEIALMTGSEGGFTPEEAQLAQSEGVFCVSLGRRILRCETAPVCALSAIMYEYGEF